MRFLARAVIVAVIAAVMALTAPAGALASTGPGCTDTWNNSSGGAWDTASDWTTSTGTHAVPTSSDNVCITAAGSYTVIVGNETITVASLTVGGSGSTPTLQIGNGGSNFPHFSVSGAIANSGTINYGFGGTFAAGSMTNSGTFEVPNTSFPSALTFGDVTNTGTFSVLGAASATLALNPGATFDNAGGTISNGTGTLAVSTSGSPAGTLQLDANGLVSNAGTLNVADAVKIDGGSVCGNALNVGSGDNGTGGSLNFAGPGAGPACGAGLATDHIFIYNVTATLAGTIPAAYTVAIGDGGTSFFTVSLSGNVVNNGTLQPGFGGTLSSPTSSDFVTNNGTFTVPASPFITPLNAVIVNNGTLEFKAGVTASLPTGDAWTNASTGKLIIDTGVTVAFSSPSGQTAGFTQDGLITNSGTLNVADAVTINGGSICNHALNVGSGDNGTGGTLSFAANPAKGPACATGQAKNHIFIYNVTASITSNLPLGFTVAIGDGGSSFAHVSTPGNFTNAGVLSPGFGATFTVNGLFTNSGSVAVPASNFVTNLDPTTMKNTSTGTISVPKSTKLVLNGTLTNYNSATSTLTGGIYTLAGVLQYTGSEFTATGIVHDAAHITLTGSGEFEDANNANALRNVASIAANSLLALGANLATVGSFSNAGALTLPAAVKLTVNGNYSQASTGTWTEGVNSTTSYGKIAATGTSTLAGKLVIAASTAFTGHAGTVLTPLSSSGRTGTFSSVTNTGAGTKGDYLVIGYTATGYTLTVATATITLNPTSGAAGSSFTVTGTGFSPGETVKLKFGTTALTAAVANSSGDISQAETVPSVAAGSYKVTATGQSSGAVVSATFTVT